MARTKRVKGGTGWCGPVIIYVLLELLALYGIMNQPVNTSMKMVGVLLLLKSIPWIFMLYWLCRWGMYKWAWAGLVLNFFIIALTAYSMVMALLQERRTVQVGQQG